MGLAGPERLSTHKCRHCRAAIEKRRTDPDAEFLGGSNPSECSPENRNGPQTAERPQNEGSRRFKIPFSQPASPQFSIFSGETIPEVDLGEVFREVNRIIRSDAVIRKVALTLDLRQPLRAIVADRIQIQQAIINLLLNAFDAVSEAEERSRRVTLSVLTEDSGCIKVLVHDSGRGIEPDALPKIFDAFFTTKAGGMGMGLAISRSIIEAHGGRLSVSSNPGHGSTFEIALPCPV